MDKNVTVTPSEKDFTYWLARDYVDVELRETLRSANALVVPQEGAGHYAGPLFPVGTEQLYGYLRMHASAELQLDVCIADRDYKELARHADWIYLATVVVKYAVAPTLVGLLANYLFDRMKAKPKVNDPVVLSTIIVVDERPGHRRSTALTYEGPPAGFKKALEETLRDGDNGSPT